jgi:exodeoxyribonuclease VII small subunit
MTNSEEPSVNGGFDDLAQFSFEDLLAELEMVTARIEGRDIGIEAATDLYERARRLHRVASDRLASVEARIQSIDAAVG